MGNALAVVGAVLLGFIVGLVVGLRWQLQETRRLHEQVAAVEALHRLNMALRRSTSPREDARG